MPKFPQWTFPKKVDASSLDQMVPNIITKVSNTTITSNTTLANDAELSGIAMVAGTWEIYVVLFANGVTGGRLKTSWAYTGTVTGTPIRSVAGPASGNAAGPLAITPTLYSGLAYNTATDYGLNTSTNPPYYQIREESTSFVVSTSGSFSVQVAQTASSATSTIIWPGSWVKVRQIA